jgi:Flp pilus assembly pilin Flp
MKEKLPSSIHGEGIRAALRVDTGTSNHPRLLRRNASTKSLLKPFETARSSSFGFQSGAIPGSGDSLGSIFRARSLTGHSILSLADARGSVPLPNRDRQGVVCANFCKLAPVEVRLPGKTKMYQFFRDERGQDLIEYTLLLAFIALAGAVLFIGMGTSISSIWTVVNSRLASAAGG